MAAVHWPATNSPASRPKGAPDEPLLEDWKKAQERCRKDLQGTSFHQGLRFESVGELYDDLLALRESQDNAVRELVTQLRPCLDIFQDAFLIVAIPSSSLKVEGPDTKLFFGLLYLILTVRNLFAQAVRSARGYRGGDISRRSRLTFTLVTPFRV